MSKRIVLAVAMFLSAASASFRAQGCSDAGSCTAGPMGGTMVTTDSTSHAPREDHMVRLTAGYAVGERQTTIVQAVAEEALYPMPRRAFS